MSSKIVNDVCENLIYNIKWLRNHYDFTKEKMAEIMCISVNMLDEIENGKLPPELTVEVLYKINNFFYIDIITLIGKHLDKK